MNNLFDTDTPSCNDTAYINLPAGWGDYTIKKAEITSPQGKADVYATFGFSDGKTTYTQPIYLGRGDGQALSDNEATRKRIAAGVMRGLWEASKLTGNPGPDRMPNFIGKRVRLRVEHREYQGKTFADIKEVRDPETAAPASNFHQPEDPDDKIDMTESKPAETPAPAPAATEPAAETGNWRRRKKTA